MMTPNHPQWVEFMNKLAGPGYCDFQRGPEGPTWMCNGTTFAEAILADMGFAESAISDNLEFFAEHGGFCDCEIVFNVESSFHNAQNGDGCAEDNDDEVEEADS